MFPPSSTTAQFQLSRLATATANTRGVSLAVGTVHDQDKNIVRLKRALEPRKDGWKCGQCPEYPDVYLAHKESQSVTNSKCAVAQDVDATSRAVCAQIPSAMRMLLLLRWYSHSSGTLIHVQIWSVAGSTASTQVTAPIGGWICAQPGPVPRDSGTLWRHAAATALKNPVALSKPGW